MTPKELLKQAVKERYEEKERRAKRLIRNYLSFIETKRDSILAYKTELQKLQTRIKDYEEILLQVEQNFNDCLKFSVEDFVDYYSTTPPQSLFRKLEKEAGYSRYGYDKEDEDYEDDYDTCVKKKTKN